MLVNTSFNVRGEPIVCSPADAYRCFMATDMDALVIEDFVLLKEEQPAGPPELADSRRKEVPARDPLIPDPSPVQLRVFAGLWLFFGAVAAVAWSRGGPPHLVLAWAAAAVTVPLAGWLVPGVLRLVYLAAAWAAWPVGYSVSVLLLSGVYYLVLTPTGVLLRLSGRDPVQRRFDRGAESYWEPREGEPNVDRYFRQF